MVIFTAEGPRSIDDRDVIAVYRNGGDGRYTHAVLILDDGSEIAGAVANDALARLEGELADMLPPVA